ncbi:hypothetical protein PPYR_15321 [Photinus pyralis]|uniref:Uncharacterized protein n=1 Tax=Photinus pyralis TaxID=7054 RepID=A0A5N3ZZ88_PHOPY|nr:hypothetical protein PPYR_15321 [Photinus pyralis]
MNPKMSPEEIDGSNSIQQLLACNAREMLLPSKSKTVYEAAYREYRKWYWGKKINCTTEDCILAYFSELVSYKSSPLWSKYSMLRSTINLNEGVDISKFPSLIPYLKRKGDSDRDLTILKLVLPAKFWERKPLWQILRSEI